MTASPFLSPRALVAALFAALLFVSASAHAEGDPERGKALIWQRGCVSCHSMDGTPSRGPKLVGLYGTRIRVVTDGVTREILVDKPYLKRSILDPAADVAEGYLPGAMPWLPVTDAEADHIVAAIAALGKEPTTPRTNRIIGVVFVVIVLLFVIAFFLHKRKEPE